MTDTDLRPAVAFPAALEAFLDSPHRTRRDTVWHRRATDFYEQPMRALAEAADHIGSAREYAYSHHCPTTTSDSV